MKLLVTAKVHPDLDGTACTLAYADLLNRIGQSAEGSVFGDLQSEVKYFQHQQGISLPHAIKKAKYEGFVLVDASSMKGLPDIVRPAKVIEVIDHRVGEPRKEFPGAKIQNDLIGAAATIIVERFQKAGLCPQPDHAKLLYGAIFHNTLNLLSTNTTDRDRRAIKYLESRFGLTPELARDMFKFSSDLILADIHKAISDDSKEFAAFKSAVRAYQLILWRFQPEVWSSQIAAAVGETDALSHCEWSFLNVIDLKSNTSFIFCPTPAGRAILSSALSTTFSDSWAALHPALLRKQIMPLLTSPPVSGSLR